MSPEDSNRAMNNRQRKINQDSDIPTYYIFTYGCQMNEHDSEILAGQLESLGYVPSESEKEADVILFNTCCVRESAERKIYGKIGSVKKIKKEQPHTIIGVCGCMVQKPGEEKRLKEKAPHIDFVLGTDAMHLLPEMIDKASRSNNTVSRILENENRPIIEHLPKTRKDSFRAWIPIMHGCNNFCSYCIVPYVRGRERSRQPQNIINEIKELVEHDRTKEITLLGQNVNSYGADLSPKIDFADLIAEVDKIANRKRIRFMTSHPKDFSQKLIETISETKHVCEHIHLPIQSGSNRILKRMNRKYTREDYFELVKNIREEIPNVSITTDIIVGFPGETEEDFLDTVDLVEKIEWDAAFTFVYSNRGGTPAAAMSGPIDEEKKKKRLQELMSRQNSISLKTNQSLVGHKMEVMIEGVSKTNPQVWASRTRTNKLVLLPKKEEESTKPGDELTVRITEARTWTLFSKRLS